MKLTVVDSLPKVSRATPNRLQDLIKEFVNGDHDVVRLDIREDEYKSIWVCYTCMFEAVKLSKQPVKVRKRGEHVYLVKVL